MKQLRTIARNILRRVLQDWRRDLVIAKGEAGFHDSASQEDAAGITESAGAVGNIAVRSAGSAAGTDDGVPPGDSGKAGEGIEGLLPSPVASARLGIEPSGTNAPLSGWAARRWFWRLKRQFTAASDAEVPRPPRK